jgi:limonene-1,2-epoxide hydrolase
MELSSWRKASLPADDSVAQTLYLDFIRRLLSEAGIDRPTIRPGRSVERAGIFSRIPVTVDARADLAKLTAFLKAFEDSPLLHQIRRLRIQPVLKENKIESYDLSMSLEGVSMPDSFAKDTLPTKESAGDLVALRPARRDQEFKVFVEKNPFQPTAVTSASAVIGERKDSAAVTDERSEYYLRAVLFVEGEGIVWFVKQGADEKKILKAGEKLEVGGLSATVEAIEPDAVRLKVGDGVGIVRLGKNLADWKKVSSGEPATTTATSATGEVEKSAQDGGASETDSSPETKESEAKPPS